MTFEGVLTKMTTEFTSPVNYYLIFNDNFIHMNQLLDKTIRFSFWKLKKTTKTDFTIEETKENIKNFFDLKNKKKRKIKIYNILYRI